MTVIIPGQRPVKGEKELAKLGQEPCRTKFLMGLHPTYSGTTYKMPHMLWRLSLLYSSLKRQYSVHSAT